MTISGDGSSSGAISRRAFFLAGAALQQAAANAAVSRSEDDVAALNEAIARWRQIEWEDENDPKFELFPDTTGFAPDAASGHG